MRISNARAIADIEYVIDSPSQASDATTWISCDVSCRRDRHRYSGQDYAFVLEVLHLEHTQPRKSWHVVIVSELWRFKGMKNEPRWTKSLRVIMGKPGDVLAWMRHSREQKLRRSTS
jgi:hypothetical protein